MHQYQKKGRVQYNSSHQFLDFYAPSPHHTFITHPQPSPVQNPPRFSKAHPIPSHPIPMASSTDPPTNPAQSPDLDSPVEPNLELAQFAAGCFWGVELSFQRVEGVVKTEVGYSQGHLHNPTYKLVCAGDTNHAEVVRIHFDPTVCPYKKLLDVFWARHDPTTLNRQGNDVGVQYRSGIYYYNDGQAELAKESLEAKQKELEGKKIVTEILPAKRFYRAEEYHQQYLEKGGRRGLKQSAAKGCNDPIRCYG